MSTSMVRNHTAKWAGCSGPVGIHSTPNWKNMPMVTTAVPDCRVLRYGRGSPSGQVRSAGDPDDIRAKPQADVEAELGWVVGVGSSPGEPVLMEDFRGHVFGVAT